MLKRVWAALVRWLTRPSKIELELVATNRSLAIILSEQRESNILARRLVAIAELDSKRNGVCAAALEGIAQRITQIGPHT